MKSLGDFMDILSRVSYRDWIFHVGLVDSRPYLQARFSGTCASTGVDSALYGRKWFLSPHMTTSEVVTTALKAVLTAEEHEARERFTYRGRRIFGPHLDVEALVWLLEREGATDEREAAE